MVSDESGKALLFRDFEIAFEGIVIPASGDGSFVELAVDHVVICAATTAWSHGFHVDRTGFRIERRFREFNGIRIRIDGTGESFAVVFEDNGHLISVARTRTPIALPVSRQRVLRKNRHGDEQTNDYRNDDLDSRLHFLLQRRMMLPQ